MSLLAMLPPLFALLARGRWLYPITLFAILISLLGSPSQEWGVYHYHLGSKFFKEVGYFDLYSCSALATGQTALYRRDLRTYQFENEFPFCDLSAWEGERWEEFKAYVRNDLQFNNGMMRDKGLNATPTWIFLGEKLSSVPVSILIWLDIVAIVAALMFAYQYVGLRRVAWAVLFMTTFVGTLGRLWFHFGQWWWLSLVVVGWVLLQNQKRWGAAFVGLSASLAIFPALLMIGRKRDEVTWAGIGLAVGLLLGLFTSRGIMAYVEFAENMLIHSSVIRSEPYNMGLFNQFALLEKTDIDSYLTCFRGGGCQDTYQHISIQWWWIIIAVPFLFSMFGRVFALLTLSRFYWQMLVLVPLFESERSLRWLFAANFAVYLFMALDRDGSWKYGNFIWMVYFVAPALKIAMRRIYPCVWKESSYEVKSVVG